MKILLINQGKTENLGDKSINISLKRLLEENGSTVFTAGYSQTEVQNILDFSLERNTQSRVFLKKYIPPYMIYLMRYRKKIELEYNEMLKSGPYGLIIIGGGQLIKSDSVFTYALNKWVSLLSRDPNAKVVLFGVGVDKTFDLHEKVIYRKIFKKIESIHVRDQQSKDILEKEMSVKSSLVPDVAYSYSRMFPRKINEVKKNQLMIMIYDYPTLVNHFGYTKSQQDYYNEWKGLLQENRKESSEVVLTYTTIGDRIETHKFYDYLKNENFTNIRISETSELDLLVNEFEKSYLIITGRMHAMILGMSYNINIQPFTVSPKIESFIQDYLESKTTIEEYDKLLIDSISNLMI